MLSDKNKDRGILAKLIEKGIEFFLRKECKEIEEININIYATSNNIIKGCINKINMIGKGVNYKDLLFDEIELETNEVKLQYIIRTRELKFKNIIILKFKILLSEKSLSKILRNNNWNWISNTISKEILNLSKLEEIKINENLIEIRGVNEDNTIIKTEKLNMNSKLGKIFLENKTHDKCIKIPIEDKIYISKAEIKNNSIIISANSALNL